MKCDTKRGRLAETAATTNGRGNLEMTEDGKGSRGGRFCLPQHHGFDAEMIIQVGPFDPGIRADERVVIDLLYGGVLKLRIPIHGRGNNSPVGKLHVKVPTIEH